MEDIQPSTPADVPPQQQRSSHRRKRPANRATYYGGVVLLAVCLSSSTWALTPSSPRSITKTTPSTTTISSSATTKPPVAMEETTADLEFTVPVEDEEESASSSRRKRQYNPVAADRAVLHMEDGLSTTESNKQNSKEEFELHVGKALDTLRSDYPNLLTTLPDLSIYDRNIEIVDPSGVTVHGLKTYQNSFRLMQGLVRFLYCPGRSTMSFRMCFDKARRNIRIHWNAAVVPREVFGGSRSTLHVDGISVYELNQATGNIVQHRIEQLLINNMPVRPKEGVIAALRDEHSVTVPSFYEQPEHSNILRFQPAGLGSRASLPSSLFAMEASESESASTNGGEDPSASAFAFDPERFAAKNKSRKKFGLKPLTEEEFMAIELQVKQMDAEQRQRAAAAAQSQAATTAKPEKKKDSFVDKLFGNVLKDTCESNWDCERPEVCCDFGFKKMCCSSGSLVSNAPPQYALVPVPVDVGPPRRNPEPRNY